MRCGAAVVLVLLIAASPARARPLVLDDGELEARLTGELGLAPGELGHSTSLAPDVWWGVTPRWTIGLVHSNASVDRFEPGASFCLVDVDASLYGGCDRTYTGSGVDVRWGALPWLAPRARLLVHHLRVWKPAVTLGALARWERGRFAITGDPYLQLGLANTDRGNRAQLVLPVTLTAEVLHGWWLDVTTGYASELAVWSDGYRVPFAGSVRAAVTDELEVGVLVGFDALLGPVNTGKERVLMVSVTRRWQP